MFIVLGNPENQSVQHFLTVFDLLALRFAAIRN